MEFPWKCDICRQTSLFLKEENDTEIIDLKCDENKHREFEKKSTDPSQIKCIICNRFSIKTRDGDFQDGCSIFLSTKELKVKLPLPPNNGILSFHDSCFNFSRANENKIIAK